MFGGNLVDKHADRIRRHSERLEYGIVNAVHQVANRG